jgi:hypothetical protein
LQADVPQKRDAGAGSRARQRQLPQITPAECAGVSQIAVSVLLLIVSGILLKGSGKKSLCGLRWWQDDGA